MILKTNKFIKLKIINFYYMDDSLVFFEKHIGIFIVLLTILLLFFIAYAYGRSAKFNLIIVFGMLFISIFFMIVGWIYWPK